MAEQSLSGQLAEALCTARLTHIYGARPANAVPFEADFLAADAVLALLRERGMPMSCVSILFNEWATDETADPAAARFVMLDFGEES